MFSYSFIPVLAVTKAELKKVIDDTGDFMYRTVTTPQVGSVGGEWAILGLARADHPVSENYYDIFPLFNDQIIEESPVTISKRSRT